MRKKERDYSTSAKLNLKSSSLMLIAEEKYLYQRAKDHFKVHYLEFPIKPSKFEISLSVESYDTKTV